MFDQYNPYAQVAPYGQTAWPGQYSAQQRLNQLQSQMQPPAAPPQGLIRVTGMDGAKAFQMAPNSVAALFDANDDVFFVKSTDGAGFPTIRAFRFAPIESTEPQNGYVTWEEFNKLKEMVFSVQQPVRKQPADQSAGAADPE